MVDSIYNGLISSFASAAMRSQRSKQRQSYRDIDSPMFKSINYKLESGGNRYSRNDFKNFVSENSDLLSTLSQIKDIGKTLERKTISTRSDLEKVIVEEAQRGSSDFFKQTFDEAYLKSHMDLAKIFATNVGGLRDLVEKKQDLAKKLKFEPSNYLDENRLRMANHVASMFDEGHPLSDPAIYQERTRVAVYLLDNPEVMQSFKEVYDGESKSSLFKSVLDDPDMKTSLEGQMVARASELMNSGAYNNDFLSNNISVSELVVISEVFKELPTFKLYLQKHPEYALGNNTTDKFNLDSIVSDIVRIQSIDSYGHNLPISEETMEAEFGVAMALLTDRDFKEAVTKAGNAFKTALGYESGSFSDEFLESLSGAFQSGYANQPKVVGYVA